MGFPVLLLRHLLDGEVDEGEQSAVDVGRVVQVDQTNVAQHKEPLRPPLVEGLRLFDQVSYLNCHQKISRLQFLKLMVDYIVSVGGFLEVDIALEAIGDHFDLVALINFRSRSVLEFSVVNEEDKHLGSSNGLKHQSSVDEVDGKQT